MEAGMVEMRAPRLSRERERREPYVFFFSNCAYGRRVMQSV